MISGLNHIAFIGPGGPELIVVMLVLLLMFGAKDAPRMFRKLNEMINHLRSTAENFKREVMYGDIGDQTHHSDTAGEYDDYGVSCADRQDACPQDGGEGVGNEASEAEPHMDTGEDGDVEKS